MSCKPWPVPPSWVGPIDDFRVALIAGGRSIESVKLRVRWVKRFARDLDVSPWEVGDLAVVTWSGGQAWASDTRRSAHQSIRAFYVWAVGAGHIDHLPVIPSVRQSAPSPHPADARAVELALASDDTHVVLMVRLAAEAGLRRGEVARVHSRDLVSDLLGRSLIVHGKGGRQRVVPLSDDLAKAVAGVGAGWVFPGADHGHLSAQWVGRLVGRALPSGVTMHALRHRFASMAYAGTHDLAAVQSLLGHASPAVTLRYVAVPDSALRQTVEVVARSYVRAA